MFNSKKKLLFTCKKLLTEIKNKKNIISYSRNSVIINQLKKKLIKIHNGKNFFNLNISKESLNFKLGEFSITKKSHIFKKKKKKRGSKK